MMLDLNNLRLGAASAAAQIEGGDLRHSWNDWSDRGRIKDGSSPRNACQHALLWEDDFKLMRDMGIRCYRLGVEWARLEQEPGRFDDSAFDLYIKMLRRLGEYGIEPLVTLHHFANPMWFEKRGAFSDKGNISAFLRYVSEAVSRLGGYAREFITINEPNVYATLGYMNGEWPPGHKSFPEALRVMSNMAYAHIEAYKIIHDTLKSMSIKDAKVGFAHHMRAFAPKNPANPLHRASAALSRRMFQGALLRACALGDFSFPLKPPFPVQKGDYCDFHGINYYTRSTVSRLGDGVRENAPKNDLGWEVYPEGIALCAREAFDTVKKPIYITENGTCDNSDSFRALYIYDHLRAVIKSGLPIERYYHWCFTDNFEWLEGESARFGIVNVNYATQERAVKESGKFYGEVIEQGGVTDEIYQKYIKHQSYSIR